MATTSRDASTGQILQQATGATTGPKLPHTEMNVLKTMVAVIVCFVTFWTAPAIGNLLQLLGVSILSLQDNVRANTEYVQCLMYSS